MHRQSLPKIIDIRDAARGLDVIENRAHFGHGIGIFNQRHQAPPGKGR
jgi:hypothetical protein